MLFKNLPPKAQFTYRGEVYTKKRDFSRKAIRVRDGVETNVPLNAEVREKKRSRRASVVAETPVETPPPTPEPPVEKEDLNESEQE